MRDYYGILNISDQANKKEIRNAYKNYLNRLIYQLDSDEFYQIQLACTVLCCTEMRHDYDQIRQNDSRLFEQYHMMQMN